MSRSRIAFLAMACAAPALAQTYFPPVTAPAGNAVTTDKAMLGMALFWDEQLSSANTVACGTCHQFRSGGTDPRAGAFTNPGPDGIYGTSDDIHGAGGVPARNAAGAYTAPADFGTAPQSTRRKAPTVVNAAYQPSLFYDGRAGDSFRDPVSNALLLSNGAALENVIAGAPVNSVEMAHEGRSWTDVTTKIAHARPLALASNLPARLQTWLGGARSYDELFTRVYGAGNTASPSRIIMAIATYVRTLVSDETPYDQMLAGSGTLSAAAQRGMTLFTQARGGAAACSQCHGDITAVSHQFGPSPTQTTPYGNLPVANSHNTGVRPIAEDNGVGGITTTSTDMGRFRAPGLRNTALHTRWFHNGKMASLDDVVAFYDRGGDFHVNQATEIVPRGMTSAERSDLVAFLQSLTDARVQNESAPFDHPTLAGDTHAYVPTAFGTGTAGTAGRITSAFAYEPVFVGNGAATIGVQGVLPGAPAFVMWDTVSVPQGFQYAGVRLYVGLYDFAVVYAGLTQQLHDGSGAGYATATFGVPALPALSGTQLYAQWLVVDPAAPVGAATSNALSVRVH